MARTAMVKDELLEVMLGAAAQAAKVICEVYRREFAVEYKSPSDPVTEADRAANELICQILAAKYPDIPIVAEESDPASFANYRSSERIFFVDPLDGTREFVARNGEFVVMIGYVEGERATHGVIHAPTTGTVWAGRVGHGAWRSDANGAVSSIEANSLPDFAGAKVFVSRSQRSSKLDLKFAELGATELVSLGSAGLKAANVADGNGDAYAAIGPAGKRWDVCAPEAVVVAAGAQLTDLLGQRFDYRSSDLTNFAGICAANERLHAQIIEQHTELAAKARM